MFNSDRQTNTNCKFKIFASAKTILTEKVMIHFTNAETKLCVKQNLIKYLERREIRAS